MGRCLTTECQGYRLPPRRFASTRFRSSRTLLNSGALFLLAWAELLAPNLYAQQLAVPHNTVNLTAAWQPLGPSSIVSATYNNITGRVAAIATDSNDLTGNTVYLGTTGGGVWKSINAAGPLGEVSFVPLTDTLPVFSNNAGSSFLMSLTIGALAVQPTVNPVLIAGTGDPNNAADSYYGGGLLIYSTATATWTLAQNSQDGTTGAHSFWGLVTAGIAFSTVTPNLVVAAFSTSPQAAVVGAVTYDSFPGLYYSADAGQTWHMATIQDGTRGSFTPVIPSTAGY